MFMGKIDILDDNEYFDFMRFFDGCLLNSGLNIYSLEDLHERNETYEISECAPGFLLIGDDSGGTGFLLSMDKDNKRVFSSDLGDLDPKGFDVVAASFNTWLETVK